MRVKESDIQRVRERGKASLDDKNNKFDGK